MDNNYIKKKIKQLKIAFLLMLSIGLLLFYLIEAKKINYLFNNPIVIIALFVIVIFYLASIYKVTKILKYYKRIRMPPFLMVIIAIASSIGSWIIACYLWVKGNNLILELPKLPPFIPCPDRERVNCYINGLLSKEEVEQVEKHLSLCDRCKEIVEVTRKIKNHER